MQAEPQPSPTLKVCLAQGHTTWHNPKANQAHYTKLLNNLDTVDLILLPEMWSTGYTMKAHHFDDDAQESLELMHKMASEHSCLVGGSLIVKEDSNYYNRFYLVSADRIIAQYDKRHLFAYAGEDRIYEAGLDRAIVTYKGWRINLNICYDLRFPVWGRNQEDYDVALYVANWPDTRIAAWDTLLKARAIENQAYILGVNCYGHDAWHNNYSGHSAIVDPMGDHLSYLEGEAGLVMGTLEMTHLAKTRRDLPFLKDRDAFKLICK